MPSIIRMPELITGSESAGIVAWLVKVGDTITTGQPIVEIETDKATVEYAAERDGVLAGILLEAGDGIAVGTPMAVLAVDGESVDDAMAGFDGGSSKDADGTDAGHAKDAGGTGVENVKKDEGFDGDLDNVDAAAAEGARDPKEESAAASGAGDASSAGASDAGSHSTSEGGDGERRFASPLVRKMARDRNLDLSGVKGSGPGGRIVRKDIEGLESKPAAAPSAATQSQPATQEGKPAPAAAPAASSAPAPKTDGTYTDIPLSGMRKAIARRLTESKTTAPHFYITAHVNVDALLELRKQVNSIEGTKVSVNDFVVKAVAGALKDVPEANSIWADTAIRRFDNVDIAVAVAVPDGLLTPVVRNVEGKSLTAVGAEIKDYAERARAGKLRQHELEGGTFAVSNLGMYGTSQFAAIINPPQAGILAVGAAEKRPVVLEDGSLGVATMMTVTLSADHRIIDGAVGAQWMAAFKQRIESPLSVLV